MFFALLLERELLGKARLGCQLHFQLQIDLAGGHLANCVLNEVVLELVANWVFHRRLRKIIGPSFIIMGL